jgi:hypothetical protein
MTTIATFHLGAPDRAPIPEIDGYRIVRYPHGQAVFGPVPAGDVEGLVAMFTAAGLNIWDVAVASFLEATICATTPEGSAAWRADIEEQARRDAGGDRELEWLLGWDKGFSSMSLLALLGESDRATEDAARRLRYADGGQTWRQPPLDAEDFGRCSRLLDRFPPRRSRLWRVGQVNDAWCRVVVIWFELEALYAAALAGDERADRRLTGILSGLALSARHPGLAVSTVDLSGLPHEGDLVMAGHDAVIDAVNLWAEGLDAEEPPPVPDLLYVIIPPAPGASTLFWSRDPEDETVVRGVRRAIDAMVEEGYGR